MNSWARASFAAAMHFLFGRVPATVADVVQDRFVEQLGLLRHQRDPLAELGSDASRSETPSISTSPCCGS